MDAYQNLFIHYVYTYRDEEDEVVYVGHGCKGRAWHCGYMRGDTLERQEWKELQLSKGLLPCDWVQIEERGLTKQAAINREKELISSLKPTLNCVGNPAHSKSIVSHDEINRWIALRKEGLTYKEIAETSDFTTMTIWRALSERS